MAMTNDGQLPYVTLTFDAYVSSDAAQLSDVSGEIKVATEIGKQYKVVKSVSFKKKNRYVIIRFRFYKLYIFNITQLRTRGERQRQTTCIHAIRCGRLL